MMESSLAARTYTEEQIKPLVGRNDPVFHPQTVPAYAATEHFNYFRNAYPEYSYKEATLNPTNPRDRAVDWEADIINMFRNNPEKKVFSGERDTPIGLSLYLARPIKALPSCLVCHSTPEVAPASVVKVYVSDQGCTPGTAPAPAPHPPPKNLAVYTEELTYLSGWWGAVFFADEPLARPHSRTLASSS